MLLRLGSLLFALPALILLVLYGLEMSAVSDCTQLGGIYNFDTAECGTEAIAQTSYYMRHSGLVNGMMLLSVGGALAMSIGMLIKGMAQQAKS
ncbi:hypothetical protein [Thalassolituus sp.]|jgi:hypothetical protein|uniref:hypothetical protein n=1 Tax=Thalassolituus sp. TaxID=2030822 RepID=UPI002A835D3A|nr:hypothetical protein [Thalassolituus sp.]